MPRRERSSKTRPKRAPPPEPARVAWVLAGGGARGAYQIGVCDYIFDRVARALGAPPPLDILCGTSVGALHACALASRVDDPRSALRALAERWTSLQIGDVVRVDRRGVFDGIRVLFRRAPPRSAVAANRGGILDAHPLEALFSTTVDFRRIGAHLAAGRLRAVSVTATHVTSGRSTVFYQRGGAGPTARTRSGSWLVPVRLSSKHALASAAIPFLFPAVRVGGALYCDGSLRQHVPLSAARHLGANALLVINPRDGAAPPTAPGGGPTRGKASPGSTFLLGKVLNALIVAGVDGDIAHLELVNRLLAAGARQFGQTFLARLNADLIAAGGPPVRALPLMHLQSSESVGRLASDYIRTRQFRAGRQGFVAGALTRLAERESPNEADLLSYALFDGGFARELIELGRRDARRAHDQLVGFFQAALERRAAR